MLHRWGQPAFPLLSVLKPGFAVSYLAAPSRSTKLPPRCHEFSDIRARLRLRLKQDRLFRRGGDADVLCPGVNAK
jgi:hypothetical protein